jgi:hypothetical protein
MRFIRSTGRGAAVETVGGAARLTPIKAVLPEHISFDQIRCVLAAHPELPRESPASDFVDMPKKSPAPLPPGSPAPSLDTIVLEAVTRLGGALGRTGLAQFLTGSKAAWLEAFAQHSCYGQLAALSQQAVVDIIDALITDGRLATTGGNRPKVVLVSQAEAKAETEVRQESHEGKIKGTEVFEDSPAKVTDQITGSVPAQDEPDLCVKFSKMVLGSDSTQRFGA